MKAITTYINEKLVLNKDNVKDYIYNLLPTYIEECINNELGIKNTSYKLTFNKSDGYLNITVIFNDNKNLWENLQILRNYFNDNVGDDFNDLNLELVEAWSDEATNKMFFRFKNKKNVSEKLVPNKDNVMDYNKDTNTYEVIFKSYFWKDIELVNSIYRNTKIKNEIKFHKLNKSQASKINYWKFELTGKEDLLWLLSWLFTLNSVDYIIDNYEKFDDVLNKFVENYNDDLKKDIHDLFSIDEIQEFVTYVCNS